MSANRVAVVADSTLAIPEAMADEAGVIVVPVHVVVDGRSLREGIEITPAEVASRLRAGARLTTSRPSPSEFLKVYRGAAERGATGVVSVHLSAELSGTAQAAKVAASSSPIPVTVVDTRTVAMAGGYAALDAASAAAADRSQEEVAASARSTADGAHLLFYVATLEYLRRGGRIGAAQRYVGQALRVKPLLAVQDGGVVALEKVRTSGRALARLAELAAEAAASLDRPRLALHHLEAPGPVAVVRSELGVLLPEAAIVESEVGAVIGVHSGPGMVAVAVVPGAPK